MANFATIFVLVSTVTTFYSTAMPEPADPGVHVYHCHVEGQPDIHLFLGESASLKGECAKVVCLDPASETLEKIGCPQTPVEENCILETKYPDAAFPDCCPSPVCA